MTNPNTAPVEQVDREGPAPLPRPETLHCAGCKHLVTKWWKDYLDNDETDSGTSARCAAVPTEHGGKSITAYWSNTTNAPDWCPFLDSAAPDLTATAPLQARVEELLSEVRRLRALAADHFRNSQRLAARVVELERLTDKSV